MQAVPVDEGQHLVVRRHWRGRERLHEAQDVLTAPQRPARQFTDNERMRQDAALFEQVLEVGIRPAQVIDPDGRVNEHRAYFAGRRRRSAR